MYKLIKSGNQAGLEAEWQKDKPAFRETAKSLSHKMDGFEFNASQLALYYGHLQMAAFLRENGGGLYKEKLPPVVFYIARARSPGKQITLQAYMLEWGDKHSSRLSNPERLQLLAGSLISGGLELWNETVSKYDAREIATKHISLEDFKYYAQQIAEYASSEAIRSFFVKERGWLAQHPLFGTLLLTAFFKGKHQAIAKEIILALPKNFRFAPLHVEELLLSMIHAEVFDKHLVDKVLMCVGDADVSAKVIAKARNLKNPVWTEKLKEHVKTEALNVELAAQLGLDKPDFEVVVGLIKSGAHLGNVKLAEKSDQFKHNVLLALAYLTGIDDAETSSFVVGLRLQSKVLAETVIKAPFDQWPADKRFALLPTRVAMDLVPGGEVFRDLLINMIIFKGTPLAKAFDSDADRVLQNARKEKDVDVAPQQSGQFSFSRVPYPYSLWTKPAETVKPAGLRQQLASIR